VTGRVVRAGATQRDTVRHRSMGCTAGRP